MSVHLRTPASRRSPIRCGHFAGDTERAPKHTLACQSRRIQGSLGLVNKTDSQRQLGGAANEERRLAELGELFNPDG